MTSALPIRTRFLREIWKRHPNGDWLFLAARREGRWIECPIQKNKELPKNLRAFFRKHPATKYDLYFCPNTFQSPRRKAEEAYRTPYAWCDIDEADPYRFVPPPSVLWESSPGRFQGIWSFGKRLSARQAERISKYLTYEFDGDHNGWTVTKVLRIPGTYNHKSDYDLPRVQLHRFVLGQIDPRPLLRRAPRLRSANPTPTVGDLNFDLDRDPKLLIKKYRRAITNRKAKILLRHERVFEQDRSRQIFIIMTALVDAEVPWCDIACLIWHNVYFRSKHGENLAALEGEVQRAMNKIERKE